MCVCLTLNMHTSNLYTYWNALNIYMVKQCPIQFFIIIAGYFDLKWDIYTTDLSVLQVTKCNRNKRFISWGNYVFYKINVHSLDWTLITSLIEY